MKDRGESEKNIYSRLQYEKIEYQNIEKDADYTIKNDDFGKCVSNILSIIESNEK